METVTTHKPEIDENEIPVLLFADGGETMEGGEAEQAESDAEENESSIHALVEKRLRDKQKNKEFKDTAIRVGGSKKELAAYKIVTRENLAELEKDQINAYKIVKKDAVYPKVNIEEERANGVSSGAVYLKVKIRESLAGNPPNSTFARELYVGLIDTLIKVLSVCYTVAEIRTYLVDVFRFPSPETFGLYDLEKANKFQSFTAKEEHPEEYEEYKQLKENLHKLLAQLAKEFDPKVKYYSNERDGYKLIVGARFLNMVGDRGKASDVITQAKMYEAFTKEQEDEARKKHNEYINSHIARMFERHDEYKKADDKRLQEEFKLNKRFFTYWGYDTLEKVRKYWMDYYDKKAEEATKKLDQLPPLKLARQEDWSWVDVKKEKTERTKTTEIEINSYPPLPYLKRKGGLEVDVTLIADQNLMADTFGYRAVEFGNWVKDEEARQHVKYFTGAMLDLSEALNIDIVQVNRLGGLSIGFGSRGRGKALATYWADRKFINITKKRGDGSVAHEWGHYFDNVSFERDANVALPIFYTEQVHKINKSKGRYGAYVASEQHRDELAKAFRDVMSYIKGDPSDDTPKKIKRIYKADGSTDEKFSLYDSDIKVDLPTTIEYLQRRYSQYFNTNSSKHNKLNRILQFLMRKFNANEVEVELSFTGSEYFFNSSSMNSPYWSESVELFARAWECFVYDKLEEKGLFNNYLVGGSYFGKKVYPQGEERKDLFKLFDALILAFKAQFEISDFNDMGIKDRVDETVEFTDEPETTETEIETVAEPVSTPATESTPVSEPVTAPVEDARTTAIGLLSGSKVERVEAKGYEFVQGELKAGSEDYYNLVGFITGNYADRLIGKGITIRKKTNASLPENYVPEVGDLIKAAGYKEHLLIKSVAPKWQTVSVFYTDPDELAQPDLKWSDIKELISRGGQVVENKTETNMQVEKTGPLKLSDIPKDVKLFMPEFQQRAIVGSVEHWEVLARLEKIIKEMPKTYQTESIKRDDKILWLHYFYQNSDWYIIEKDKGDASNPNDKGEQHQAFGFVILGDDLENAEMGYISIEELKATGKVELDFYFEPIKLGELLEERKVEEEDKQPALMDDGYITSRKPMEGDLVFLKTEYNYLKKEAGVQNTEQELNFREMYFSDPANFYFVQQQVAVGKNAGGGIRIQVINKSERRDIWVGEEDVQVVSDVARKKYFNVDDANAIYGTSEQAPDKTNNEQFRDLYGDEIMDLQYQYFIPRSKELERVWREELEKAGGPTEKTKELQEEWIAYNKEHLPVIVKQISGIDFLSQLPYRYGEINFSLISGWADMTLFHKVVNGKYVPNETGAKIGIRHSQGGGSAFLNFDASHKNASIVKTKLEKAGYIVYLELAPFQETTAQASPTTGKIGVSAIHFEFPDGKSPKTFQDFQSANAYLSAVIENQKNSDILYQIIWQDGESLEGSIDLEPLSFWKNTADIKQPLSWHTLNFQTNIANTDKSYVSQEDKEAARMLVTKYDFGYTGNVRIAELKNNAEQPITLTGRKEDLNKTEETIVISSDQHPLLMEQFKNANQATINDKIRAICREKGIEREKYSADDLQFIQLYEGAGGLAKQGEEGARLLDQFFTPEKIVTKMWGLATKYGFVWDNSLILEPAVGSGRFLKYIPKETNARVVAYDVDETCYTICKVLYPDFDIRHGSFESMFFMGRRNIGLAGVQEEFDLVIGNPPYRPYISEYSVLGEKEATLAENFEHYFIMRGVDVLKPNGLLIYIIPNTFMSNDNKYNKFKEMLAKKCELIDAYRLPNGVFGNTEVGTDIIVLRRK